VAEPDLSPACPGHDYPRNPVWLPEAVLMPGADRPDQRLAEDLWRLSRQPLQTDVLAKTKITVLDAIANAIDGSTHPAAEVAARATEDGTGPCTMIGRRRGVTAPDAAFVHSVMIHSTMRDDFGGGGFAQGTHPSSYVVSAALAIAEQRGLSGLDFLTSVVVGYEAVGRIGAAAPPTILARGFRSVPVIGVFGAAAATASLLGLRPDAVESALAIAAHLSGGLTHGFPQGTMEPFLHTGLSARNGVHAALLAQAGAVTAGDTLAGAAGWCVTLAGESGDWSAHPDDELSILRVKHKSFPVNGVHQNTMTLIVEKLRDQPRLRESDIEHVLVRRPSTGPDRIEPAWLKDPPYQNLLQAQLSAKFTAIAALLRRPISELGYFRDSFDDAEVRAVIERSSFVVGDGTDIEIVVTLRTGKSVHISSETGLGDPSHDLVRDRFLALSAPYLADLAVEVGTIIDSLEKVEDITALTERLRCRATTS
jgi:2-methylcitrate dehydratase PrpD